MSEANGSTPERDWIAIRHEYEATTISRRKLAVKHTIPYGTLEKRAKREGWMQNAKLVRKSVSALEAKIEEKTRVLVDRQMAPWIEEQKIKFTKRGFKVADRGIKRVVKMMDAKPDPDAKEEAFISKAAETYHRIGRVALGMSDGSPVGGVFNLGILTNHAAVQFVAPNES